MKRLFLAVALVAFTVFRAVPGASAGEKIVLKLASFEPVGGAYQVCWYDSFRDIFNRLAKGEAEVHMYAGGSLLSAMDQTKGIRDGVADLGQFVTPYEVGRSPILGVYELPFTFVSMDKEVETNRELMKAGMEKFFLETQNVKPLAAQRTWPYSIWANKKITRMEDLKGVKMRTPGGMQAEGMSMLGATPVTIAAGEVYIGLQRGTIDGTLYTPAFVASRKLQEVAKNGLLVPFSVSGGIFVINLNTWKRLPPHIQEITVQAAHEMEQFSIRCIEAAEKKYTEEFQKQGVGISTLTKEEEARWVRTVRPLWDKYAAENGEMGKQFLNVMKKVKNFE